MDRSLGCIPPKKGVDVTGDASSSKEVEKLALEKIMSGPYVSHQAFPQELEELEDDLEFKNQVRCVGNTSSGPAESSMSDFTRASPVHFTRASPVQSSNGAGPSTGLHASGVIEELEVVLLSLSLLLVSRSFIIYFFYYIARYPVMAQISKLSIFKHYVDATL